MRLLSCDHATSLSADFVAVSWRAGALPSAGTIQRSFDDSFSSYDGLLTLKTTHLPSGLMTGLLTRGMVHSSSCVSAFFAAYLMMRGCSVCAIAAAARKTKRKKRLAFRMAAVSLGHGNEARLDQRPRGGEAAAGGREAHAEERRAAVVTDHPRDDRPQAPRRQNGDGGERLRALVRVARHRHRFA